MNSSSDGKLLILSILKTRAEKGLTITYGVLGSQIGRRVNVLVIAVSATALMTVPALAQTYGDHPHMGAWGWGGMIFGPIMMIVFIAVAVVVVVLLVRWLGGPEHGGALHSPPGKTPLDILKERFAKGEIDKEEFEERRRVLGE